jgi:hypothetical protein
MKGGSGQNDFLWVKRIVIALVPYSTMYCCSAAWAAAPTKCNIYIHNEPSAAKNVENGYILTSYHLRVGWGNGG